MGKLIFTVWQGACVVLCCCAVHYIVVLVSGPCESIMERKHSVEARGPAWDGSRSGARAPHAMVVPAAQCSRAVCEAVSVVE